MCISFPILSRSPSLSFLTAFSATDLCLCPALPCIPLGCYVWWWKGDRQRQPHWWFPPNLICFDVYKSRTWHEQTYCWSSRWVFFPFSCDNVSISGWQNATWDDGFVYSLVFWWKRTTSKLWTPWKCFLLLLRKLQFLASSLGATVQKAASPRHLSTTCQLYRTQLMTSGDRVPTSIA